MKPNWYGIVGWLFMFAGFVLAAFFVPYPHNGSALAALALGGAGGFFIMLAVRDRPDR